jgi:hypothetical protein
MRAALAICLSFGFVLAGSSPVRATCIGSDTFSTCSDNSGNQYTVRRFGNSTYLNGSNAETGSTWSQTSRTLGNTTYHNGVTNGNPWNMTDQRFENTRTYSGTDSQGNNFFYRCGTFGCAGGKDGGFDYGQPQTLPDNQDDQSLNNYDQDDQRFGIDGSNDDQTLDSNDDDDNQNLGSNDDDGEDDGN